MRVRNLHRTSACILGVFLILHLGNHAVLILGPDQAALWHQRIQDMLRQLYRQPLIEPVLIASLAEQVTTGLRLLIRRGWPKRRAMQVQSVTGAVLAFFMIQHVSAVLMARMGWPSGPDGTQSLDTTIYFAASVLHPDALPAYFAPYYLLGTAAIGLHLASFAMIRRRRILALTLTGFSILFATLITAGLWRIAQGPLQQPYLDYIARTFG